MPVLGLLDLTLDLRGTLRVTRTQFLEGEFRLLDALLKPVGVSVEGGHEDMRLGVLGIFFDRLL
ncbi:MAG: Uncharacterised protein [Prochlorococcus marinus str. MIT 9215]|nr:MAG: Uncharacterised protein [Prochlorococcus marinus str. MIT 9215]